MIEINLRTNVKEFQRKLSDLAYKQMPFATAQALTSLAKIVKQSEREALPSIFDRPTPFTMNSIGVTPARKDNLQATVFVKDITAAYLAPYEFGGKTKGLGAHNVFLSPANVRLNQYGNLPKAKLAQFKANPQKFYFGKIRGKSGEEINGIWQRTPAGKGKPASLKLVVRFEDPHEAKQHMDWFRRADQLVRANINAEMSKALAKAIATAK